MARAYTAMTTLVRDKIATSSTADFSVDEINRQFEESLKELPNYQGFEHLVPVVFKIESRTGTASTASTDNLVDTPKGQFVAADATDEKVVHDITDDKRAVVLSFSSTAQIGISADLFSKADQYRIYNKRCWNKRQIYIGNVVDYVGIHSVEYPIGQRRNWKILGNEVLELEIEDGVIRDSNAGSTITRSPNVDVLVRFNKPHVLSQLTDLAGNIAASADVGATTLSGSSLQAAGTIEVGEEFYVENHRTLYMVVAETTIASNTAAIAFFPGFEAKVPGTTTVLTFVKSSLLPHQEHDFAELVAANLLYIKAPKFYNSVDVGGVGVEQNFESGAGRRLAAVRRKLTRQSKPKVSHTYSRE